MKPFNDELYDPSNERKSRVLQNVDITNTSSESKEPIRTCFKQLLSSIRIAKSGKKDFFTHKDPDQVNTVKSEYDTALKLDKNSTTL